MFLQIMKLILEVCIKTCLFQHFYDVRGPVHSQPQYILNNFNSCMLSEYQTMLEMYMRIPLSVNVNNIQPIAILFVLYNTA